jgi:hypothetical protein
MIKSLGKVSTLWVMIGVIPFQGKLWTRGCQGRLLLTTGYSNDAVDATDQSVGFLIIRSFNLYKIKPLLKHKR